MTDPSDMVDSTALQEKQKQLSGYLTGAFVSAMVSLGMRLGLYQAMDSAGPLTSDALAEKTGLQERWVREWLYAQGAAGVLDILAGEHFELSPEGAAILAHEDALSYMGLFPNLPHNFQLVERVQDSFRTGIGLTADDRGPIAAVQNERGLLGNWNRHVLVPVAIPLLTGISARLETGALVADIGCGTGVAVLELAKAFPHSEVHGYDISTEMLALAEANRATQNVSNATFHLIDEEPIPDDARFDLVLTLDCLHDMTHPEDVAAAIGKAIRPDGTWFIADIDARSGFAENLAELPSAPMLYSVSVLNCMSSSLSEPGGAGHGTLGMPETAIRAIARAVGFEQLRRLDLPHPLNAYYEVRM